MATKLDLLEDVRRRHGMAPRALHVVTAADVLDAGQLQSAAAGFDRGRPLMVLCEGLVGYLTRVETGCLIRNVHGLLSEFQAAACLHRAGFDVEVCSQVDKTPSFSTIAALHLSPALVERMRPVLRVWLTRGVARTGSYGSVVPLPAGDESVGG